ncbi:hypothetical protein MRX96_023230 [Rhipicephalus microplus]
MAQTNLGHRTLGRCRRDHATTDPQCPRRQRQPFNRSWVQNAIYEEQRQLKKSTGEARSQSSTTDASATPLTNSGRSCSKVCSTSRPKEWTKSKPGSRSLSHSTSPSIQVKRPSFYPSITGILVTLEEGILRKAGNYKRYHGASAMTGFGDQQSKGGISGGKLWAEFRSAQ